MAAVTLPLPAPTAPPPASMPVAAPRPARRPSVTALSRRLARLRRFLGDLDEERFHELCCGGPADERYFRLRRELVRTPADTIAEALVKLRLALPDEQDALGDDEEIVEAVVEDLERIARG